MILILCCKDMQITKSMERKQNIFIIEEIHTPQEDVLIDYGITFQTFRIDFSLNKRNLVHLFFQ